MRGLSFVPDKPYIQMFYLATTGKLVNFKDPKGFAEKQQWMKLHDRHPEQSVLVDKLAVREHIADVLGEEYLFPLLGKWKTFDEIEFSALPEQFVLKCNHDSGSTKVITSKSSLTDADKAELRRFYARRVKGDFFYAGREFPYKGIEPWIIAEQYMVDAAHPEASIEDYKFFCFNGVPKVLLVATDRNTDLRFDFFDMDFNHLDIRRSHPNADKPIPKPQNFERMKEIAATLSRGLRFVRLDLYDVGGQIYFGEYTFYSGGGFALFEPPEWERRMGDWLDLENPPPAG